MQFITVENKKYVVLGKVLLDHFKSDEARNKYLEGKIRLINKSNPNECIIVKEIIDAQFEDIKECIPVDKKKEEEVTPESEEIASGYGQQNFQHTINIKI